MNLLVLETIVKEYLIENVPNLNVNEQQTRISRVLDFILNIYNKHGEEVSVHDAYTILYKLERNIQ